ncbi:MAG: peptidase M61 [Proteobacteria bacterium SG_bin6]|nr:MAG: peptidase M61 [Proteobacteria bacterium SG_bin6]
MFRTLSLTALLLASGTALAENTKPQPLPIVETIPAARDTPYPGTLKLEVDATDLDRNVFRVVETIPVAAGARDPNGDMVLLFPKWLPGNHSPTGQIDKLAGLRFTAGGQTLAWKRDPVDMFAFHVRVPAGVKAIEARFEYLSPTESNQGRVVMTPALLNLQWNLTSLYPAGYFTRQIPIEARARYPEGWTAASGLPATREGAVYRYQRTDYETLVDSPVFAGAHYKRVPLSPRVNLNIFADNDKELAAKDDQLAAHVRLAEQAVKTFGAQHYDTYEFLFAISDEMAGIGLEHHRSSENGVRSGYFTDWATSTPARNLLPHEFTHSWNGKFRRGADLYTPDYRTPMRNSLLWVYEGQTQFWGYVLGARSGLVSKQDTLDAYASIMASLDIQYGRQWRPLADTTNEPIISQRRPEPWRNWQRPEDYYNEGLLVWMEVDAILRRESKGAKSIDDFARAFFGVRDGDWGELTYRFEDVVSTLNAIQPYDWHKLLTERLDAVGAPAPLKGFEGNGYRLIFTEEATPFFKAGEKAGKNSNLSYSIGLTVSGSGDVTSVIWNGPAFKAGIDVGDSIESVNGFAFSADRLKEAITAAKSGTPIVVTTKKGDRLTDRRIDYQGGLRYPRLEKIAQGEAGLDRLLAPR